jgi:DNA invertase Pin-like site-specific DNA recombinase
MTAHIIGYARVSTNEQDLTAQRNGLAGLGVPEDLIYVDHGLTGRNKERPGLREALAAVRAGDTLVVTKLDRLARSLPDARDIIEDLTKRNVKLSIGGSVHDPTDPVGRLLFNVLAMVAEFESDLIRARTREACRSRKPKAGSAANNPNSPRARKPTSSPYTREDTTPLPRSPNCSRSRGARCTGSFSEQSKHRNYPGSLGRLKHRAPPPTPPVEFGTQTEVPLAVVPGV